MCLHVPVLDLDKIALITEIIGIILTVIGFAGSYIFVFFNKGFTPSQSFGIASLGFIMIIISVITKVLSKMPVNKKELLEIVGSGVSMGYTGLVFYLKEYRGY